MLSSFHRLVLKEKREKTSIVPCVTVDSYSKCFMSELLALFPVLLDRQRKNLCPSVCVLKLSRSHLGVCTCFQRAFIKLIKWQNVIQCSSGQLD